MNNPGIADEIWMQLKEKWKALDAAGCRVKVEFKVMAHPNDKRRILLVDVVQNIDGEWVTETVQQKAGEAYTVLGINGLSKDELTDVCRETVQQIHQQASLPGANLVIEMTHHSSTSGEVRGYFQDPDDPEKHSVLLDYHCYYLLSAIREKMLEQKGKTWNSVKIICHSQDVDFYFQY